MFFVALFARAWIEITNACVVHFKSDVALFARAWIEMNMLIIYIINTHVALFARAWIEIMSLEKATDLTVSRPLCEGVD